MCMRRRRGPAPSTWLPPTGFAPRRRLPRALHLAHDGAYAGALARGAPRRPAVGSPRALTVHCRGWALASWAWGSWAACNPQRCAQQKQQRGGIAARTSSPCWAHCRYCAPSHSLSMHASWASWRLTPAPVASHPVSLPADHSGAWRLNWPTSARGAVRDTAAWVCRTRHRRQAKGAAGRTWC